MSSKRILTALLLLAGFDVNAQEAAPNRSIGVVESTPEVAVSGKTKNDPDHLYRNPEVLPKPAFDKVAYLSKNIRYPEAAYKDGIQGKVVVAFVVEKDGSLTDIKIIEGAELGHGVPEETIRVIKSMPKWKPGRQENQPVRSYFTLPISFSLPEEPDDDAPVHPGFEAPVPSKPTSKAPVGTEIYRSTNIPPKPDFNLTEFLSKNLRYPEAAIENEVQDRVYVQFVVEKDGSLTDIRIVRGVGIGYGIPEEAMRVVKAMPKWKPAMKNGQVVRAYFTMPISFTLQ